MNERAPIDLTTQELLDLKNGIEASLYRKPTAIDHDTQLLLIDIYTELRTRGLIL